MSKVLVFVVGLQNVFDERRCGYIESDECFKGYKDSVFFEFREKGVFFCLVFVICQFCNRYFFVYQLFKFYSFVLFFFSMKEGLVFIWGYNLYIVEFDWRLDWGKFSLLFYLVYFIWIWLECYIVRVWL